MNQEILSSLEIDAIGEIINISLGASATAISTMLSSRVEITVPRVRVESYENFEFKNLEPAIAVTIDYIEGILGSNIMILKKEDIRVILETLMQTQYDPENFELDEIGLSAVCEVMNQMMGAASTALSELLSRAINISTPTTFEVKDAQSFKEKNFKKGENFVVIEFDLHIENKLNSGFINVLHLDLVKDMISTFMGDMDMSGSYQENMNKEALLAGSPIKEETKAPEPAPEPKPAAGGMMSQEEIEAMLAGNRIKEETKAPEPKPAGGIMSQEEIEAMLAGSRAKEETKAPEPKPSGGMMSQEEIEALLAGNRIKEEPVPKPSGGIMSQEQIEAMLAGNAAPSPKPQTAPQTYSAPAPARQPAPEPQTYAKAEPKVIDVQDLDSDRSHLTGIAKEANLDMIMDVPLVVSVEIGRTKKPIREILEITQGSLIVLDKMAGDQVELYANNKCIAKGDVVVVHDNFGIRVTEVMGKD